MDIICATMSKQKMKHPSHPHQLERMFGNIVSMCEGCGKKYAGEFFHCTLCPRFRIHLDCSLLPVKLFIQHHTTEAFTHSHPLTLVYSFPFSDIIKKSYPFCRVCRLPFDSYLWLYKCDMCRYYVHVDCATSKNEPFMSILHGGFGRTYKNFKDDDHPNMLHCPFPDEGNNLLKHQFINLKEFFVEHDDETFNHSSHQHPLIFINTQTSLHNKLVPLHNPMKRIQLLCDACVKPITEIPFYKCSLDVGQCGFVLHEWCAKLPYELQDHPDHPEHTLVLLPNIPGKFFGVFGCNICELPSNGFAYGCRYCNEFLAGMDFCPPELAPVDATGKKI